MVYSTYDFARMKNKNHTYMNMHGMI